MSGIVDRLKAEYGCHRKLHGVELYPQLIAAAEVEFEANAAVIATAEHCDPAGNASSARDAGFAA